MRPSTSPEAARVARSSILNGTISRRASASRLQVPYVQQWALSIEREILPNTVFEARYVGNRGTKLTRAIDINQVSVVRAQRNLAANGNPAVGEALQIFPKLGDFRPFGLGFAFLNDPSIRNLIRTGQVGELANIYVVNRDLFLDPNNGFGVQLTPGFFLPANANTYSIFDLGVQGEC